MTTVGVPVAQTTSYRDAAVTFWGDAGANAYDAYDRIRAALYPELPARIPIVIGLTAYGHCLGLTSGRWHHGPRITLPPEVFQGTTAETATRLVRGGVRQVDDVLTHEMLHAWLAVTGRQAKHDSADWYEAVKRLSPASSTPAAAQTAGLSASPTPPTCPAEASRRPSSERNMSTTSSGTPTWPAGRWHSAPATTTGARPSPAPPTEPKENPDDRHRGRAHDRPGR